MAIFQAQEIKLMDINFMVGVKFVKASNYP